MSKGWPARGGRDRSRVWLPEAPAGLRPVSLQQDLPTGDWGTDLTWRRLASLRTEELETLSASDPRLAPWIARWLQARGDAPGVLLCKIVGNTSRPDESNREESLRGLVNQRLERVAPELSAAEARTEAQASFRAWNRT